MYAEAFNENAQVAQALIDSGARLPAQSESDAGTAPADVDCTDTVAVRDATNARLVSDCEALLNARDALDGGAGVLNWNTETRIRYWSGITVRLGRVVGLDLRESGIRGRIPAVLGALTELENLDLGHNELTGAIPRELGDLTNLWALSLERTCFPEIFLPHSVSLEIWSVCGSATTCSAGLSPRNSEISRNSEVCGWTTMI